MSYLAFSIWMFQFPGPAIRKIGTNHAPLIIPSQLDPSVLVLGQFEVVETEAVVDSNFENCLGLVNELLTASTQRVLIGLGMKAVCFVRMAYERASC